MIPVREPIYAGLFAIGQAITWVDPVSGATTAWQTTGRRIQTPDLIGLDGQPALLQAESDETVTQQTRMPSKRTLTAHWVIYLPAYPAPQPTGPLLHAVLDAIDAAFAPDSAVSDTFTLGGLVTHCWIDGAVFKDPGDLDGQAMLIVPIKLLVP